MRYTTSDNLRGICEMTRRFETGNVVGFVLVGVLLTAMLVGGVWLARHPAGSSSSQDTSQTTSTDKSTTDEELKQTLAEQAAKSAENKPNSSSTTPSTGSTSSNLPATGPADTLIETVGAMLLVGTFVAYVRSRSLA